MKIVKKAITLAPLLMIISSVGCANGGDLSTVDKGVNKVIATDSKSTGETEEIEVVLYSSSQEALVTDVAYSYRSDRGRAYARPLQNGSELHTGDHYKIQFTPREECYVYIFQYDSSDQLFSLFPPGKNFIGADAGNDNPVRANRTYFVPGEAKSFELDNQTGTEKILFLAYRERNLELERKTQNLLQAHEQNDTRQVQSAQAEMEGISKGAKPQVMSDEEATVKNDLEGMFTHVQGRRLVCEEDNCVSSITFEHLP
ncbi:MAG: DUF4384 domain-containing protein [Thiomargarita sp.]|nr:DUF4384 domain-containing protein [Thiomargarita sp.]